jgi:hypothetical protein
MSSTENLRQLIFEVFSAFGVQSGEYLPVQSLWASIEEWPASDRNVAVDVLESMVADGLLEPRNSPPGFVLTKTGSQVLSNVDKPR